VFFESEISSCLWKTGSWAGFLQTLRPRLVAIEAPQAEISAADWLATPVAVPACSEAFGLNAAREQQVNGRNLRRSAGQFSSRVGTAAD